VFARQAATLDVLSDGRLDVGVGLGHDGWKEFSSFSGEVVDAVERALFLDDSLEILRRLWSGEPVAFAGDRIWVNSTAFLPRPVQQPLPVWVACRWPHRRPIVRAARNQGCFPIFDEGGREMPGLPEPEQVAAVRAKLLDEGAPPDIDIICRGTSATASAQELAPRFATLEDAGMTWWLESFGRGEPPAAEVEAVVAVGPPR
jgi:alkanesulfonate monooxygenase SsuD/methylene tetrahydromethanopterin reductase-like flavin-dependent oxidoreductase (luciferase family)